MIRKSLGFAAVFLLVLSGCSSDDKSIVQETAGAKSFTTLSATFGDQSDTRAYLEESPGGSGRHVSWSDEDQILVRSDTQANLQTFKLVRIEDNVGVFSGAQVSGNVFYAFYPNQGWSFDGSFPQTVRYELQCDAATTSNGFNFQAPMVAVSNDENFAFRQTIGMIRISLSNIFQLSHVRLYGNEDESLSGPGYITLDTDSPVFRLDDDPAWSSMFVEGSFDQASQGEVMDVFFILPPMTFESGFRIEIYGLDNDGQEIRVDKSTASEVVVGRAQVCKFRLALNANFEGDIEGFDDNGEEFDWNESEEKGDIEYFGKKSESLDWDN